MLCSVDGTHADGLSKLVFMLFVQVDLVDNRVEMNLRAIANTIMVELPADRSFTYEDFISTQSRFQKKQTEQLMIRNEEVRRSIEDLMHLVKTYPRENTEVQLAEEDLKLFMRHYSKLMYQAILTSTQKSLQAMKRRLGSKTATGFLYMERPFFDVDVELKVPNVAMNPPLEDIQQAINACAKRVSVVVAYHS